MGRLLGRLQVGAQDFLHRLAGLHQGQHLAGLGLVAAAAGIAQVVHQGIFQHLNVAVFAKHQRNNQPVISRAHAPIRAVKTHKGAVLPAAHVGCLPRSPLPGRVLVVGVSGVPDVGRGETPTGADGFAGLAHQYAVHDNVLAGDQTRGCQLVLGRHGLGHGDEAAVPRYFRANRQVHQGHEHVIGGVNAGYLVLHFQLKTAN